MAIDVVTYILARNAAKKYTDATAAIGGTIDSVERLPDGHLIFTYTPTGGSPIEYDAGIVPPGKSISSTEINSSNELVLTFDDGTTQNVGIVVGPTGPTGPRGQKGDTGEQGPKGQEIRITADADVGTGYIKWQYDDEGSTWHNLVKLSTLRGKDGDPGAKGDPGDPVELRMSGDVLQWRYESQTIWNDLLDFSQLDLQAKILPYGVGELYKKNDSFYNPADGKIYTVLADYVSTNIPADIAAGHIMMIGGGGGSGGDVDPATLISHDENNLIEAGTDGKLFAEEEVFYFDHEPTSAEISWLPDGAIIVTPSSDPEPLRIPNSVIIKGSVATKDDLPSSGDIGDLYLAEDTGYQYVLTTSGWINFVGNLDSRVEALEAMDPANLYVIVDSLPVVGEENKIYIVPVAGELHEARTYIWQNGDWTLIGSFQPLTDLSNYYTKVQVDALLATVNTTIANLHIVQDPEVISYVDTNTFTVAAGRIGYVINLYVSNDGGTGFMFLQDSDYTVDNAAGTFTINNPVLQSGSIVKIIYTN